MCLAVLHTSSAPVAAYAFQPLPLTGSSGAYPFRPTGALDTDYYAVIWPPANPMAIPGMLEHPNEVLATGISPPPLGVMVFGYGVTVSYQYPAVPVPPRS